MKPRVGASIPKRVIFGERGSAILGVPRGPRTIEKGVPKRRIFGERGFGRPWCLPIRESRTPWAKGVLPFLVSPDCKLSSQMGVKMDPRKKGEKNMRGPKPSQKGPKH